MEVKRHGAVNTRVSVELWQQMARASRWAMRSSSPPAATSSSFHVQGKVRQRGELPRLSFYMPGNDAVTSYPTTNQILDGGSRYGN